MGLKLVRCKLSVGLKLVAVLKVWCGVKSMVGC